MIVIIDYGLGNLGSIKNMLKRIGAEAIISSDIATINTADKLILPGVGAFDNGMQQLDKSGLLSVLNEKVLQTRVPILGICLGMQLMTESSEEGGLPGLGWLRAKTVRFRPEGSNGNFKIPHMGWNTIRTVRENDILKGLGSDPRFYFVHSYHVVSCAEDCVLAKTNYIYDFVSVIRKDNILGVQFHPEKSHKFGMQILKNFAEFSRPC